MQKIIISSFLFLTFICSCSETSSEKAEDLIIEASLLSISDGQQIKDPNRVIECLNNAIKLKQSDEGYYKTGGDLHLSRSISESHRGL